MKLKSHYLIALERYAATLPLRVIDHEGSPYLRRYFICKIGQWHFYLHKFVDSDPAGLHNHPFKYALSILLSGSYREQTRWGIKRVKWFNFLYKDAMHRVVLDGEPLKLPVWTLFIHSEKQVRWGILTNEVVAINTDAVSEGSCGADLIFREGGTGTAREWWKWHQSENTIAQIKNATDFYYKDKVGKVFKDHLGYMTCGTCRNSAYSAEICSREDCPAKVAQQSSDFLE